MNETMKELCNIPRMFYDTLNPLNTLTGLKDMCDDIIRPDYVIVEIGSFSGLSSDCIARYCRKLVCIDFWESTIGYVEIPKDMLVTAHKQFTERMSVHSNIEVRESTSLAEAEKFDDGSIDMVYIDGRHDEASVRADIKAWLPKVKKGGWVTGHDINIGGVQVPVKEIFGNTYKSYSDSSWAAQV